MARPKKATPTVASEEITAPASPRVAPSDIVPVSLGRLVRAPENVRHTNKAVDIDGLADDIMADGLLQSLVGYAGTCRSDKSKVYIVGGGRRLQAMQLLLERGVLTEDFPVPVLLRGKGEAVTLSLKENLGKRDMNPADEFIAFDHLMKSGTVSPADLAKQFGFSERYVKQRLRFAQLHPEILTALREGKITLDFATEYAKTSDQQLQLDVFRSLQRGPSYNRENLYSLRSALASKQLTEDDAIFQFIDRATYEREGGGYVEDLFAELHEGQGRRLDNGQLARAIAERCLAFQADRVLAAARREHPTVAGYVLAPGLTLNSGRPSAPSAAAFEISGGWNSNLNRHVDIKDCWKRADELGVEIHIVIGIDREEPIGNDDDGSPLGYVSTYSRERFFVSRADSKQVLPPKQSTNYGGEQLTPEQQRAKEIEREARLWAARLAGPSFAGTPFEGKVFYGGYWLGTHERRPGDPFDAPRMASFELKVFVTEEEIAANLEAGRARAIEEREAVEAAREAKEAAKRAAAEAQAEAMAAMLEQIGALPELPAVIMANMFEDAEPEPWFLWSTGDYFNLPEDDEEAETAEGLEGLAELADTVAAITGFYRTVPEYRAAIKPAENDADAVEAEAA